MKVNLLSSLRGATNWVSTVFHTPYLSVRLSLHKWNMLYIVVPVSTGSVSWSLSTPKQKQDKNGTCTTIYITCIQYVSKQSEDDLSRQKGGQRIKSDWKEWSEGPWDFVYQKEKNDHLLNESWVVFFLGLEKEGA